jgi:hypothetical protein
MFRPRLATALIAVLALTACVDAGHLTSPTGTLPGGGMPGGTSSGDTTSTNPGDTTSTNPGDTTSTNPPDTTGAGEPVLNGTWTTPDGAPTTIEPIDGSTYVPAGSGSGAGTTGSSTALVFKTSGAGIYGVGTCGPNGFWTDPAGNVFGPNNPNCLDYGSDGSPGNNGMGQCITSASQEPGLWVNPGNQQTHPFHSKCLRVGTTTTALALTFTPQAQVFEATDGSGSRVMNFYSAGDVVAQLVYDGITGTTAGVGLLLGSDNASPANVWTVFFGQPALSYSTGLPNGDLIDALTSSGVEVVACSTSIGCSLVTLQMSLVP